MLRALVLGSALVGGSDAYTLLATPPRAATTTRAMPLSMKINRAPINEDWDFRHGVGRMEQTGGGQVIKVTQAEKAKAKVALTAAAAAEKSVDAPQRRFLTTEDEFKFGVGSMEQTGWGGRVIPEVKVAPESKTLEAADDEAAAPAPPALVGTPGAAPVVDRTGHLISADDFRHGTSGGVVRMP